MFLIGPRLGGVIAELAVMTVTKFPIQAIFWWTRFYLFRLVGSAGMGNSGAEPLQELRIHYLTTQKLLPKT
jgi:hypothetical protein